MALGLLATCGVPATAIPAFQAMPEAWVAVAAVLFLTLFGGIVSLLSGLQARRRAWLEQLSERQSAAETVEVTPRDAAALLHRTQTPSHIRVAAARFLGARGDTDSLPTLTTVAEAGGNWAVAHAARAAAQRISERGHHAVEGSLTVVDRADAGHLSEPEGDGRLCLESG